MASSMLSPAFDLALSIFNFFLSHAFYLLSPASDPVIFLSFLLLPLLHLPSPFSFSLFLHHPLPLLPNPSGSVQSLCCGLGDEEHRTNTPGHKENSGEARTQSRVGHFFVLDIFKLLMYIIEKHHIVPGVPQTACKCT